MPEETTAPDKRSRRQFLADAGGLALLTNVPGSAIGTTDQTKPGGAVKISVFSKPLQWLDLKGLAEIASEIGFDGVDLTLRKDGHIAPERAEQELPKAAEIFRKAGLLLPMVTAGIVNVNTPYAEAMLRAMRTAGISRYRWGGFQYVATQTVPQRLEELKQEARKLAELNRKYDVCAMYHTHSGEEVGSSIWDLWFILKDQDLGSLGVNLDLAHATIEGGLGAWINNTRLIGPMIRGIAIKDFKWAQNTRGEWRPQWCPLGEGMVNFKRFLALLKEIGFSGPVQLHYEYPLGGAESGSREVNLERSKVVTTMRRDLTLLRQWLHDAQLA